MENIILITGSSGFIGTNLIEMLEKRGGYKIINVDKTPPLKVSQNKYWENVNIMDYDKLNEIIRKYRPSVVLHLAARTDTLSNNLEDYVENTKGTENLIRILEKCDFVKHSIITSTQYVYKSVEVPLPPKEDSYLPHTVYGQSKVITEQLTRSAKLSGYWTIIRPTNIWGPWHMRYPIELWRMIDKGMYLHPGKDAFYRTYGYVKNIAHQIIQIIEAAEEKVSGRMFYVGDIPIDSYTWINALSVRMRSKPVKRLPKLFFWSLAVLGDALRNVKLKFPLYSERYYNMIEDYPAPTEITINEFGVYNSDLSNNVNETVKWLEEDGKEFFDYWKNRTT